MPVCADIGMFYSVDGVGSTRAAGKMTTERAVKPLLAALLALLIPGAALWAQGETLPNGAIVANFGPGSVRLQGSAQSLRLEVRDSTVAAVLATMGRAFDVQYRSTTALDDRITGTYAGSLTRIIAQVLDGYDYVIRYEAETPALDVVIFGRSQGRPAPALHRAADPAATTPMRHVRCGRSAGHQAACQPI